jgi:Ca2+-transporting ATPase
MLRTLLIIALISIPLTAAFIYDQRWIHFIDPVAILISALIVSYLSATVKNQQQNAFLSVTITRNEFSVNVIRAGEECQILSTDLLVGDLLSLKNGDAIPVDRIYVSGHAFLVDNSQTTGESIPVAVNESNAVVLSGTAVDSGDVINLVCAVGEHSQFGIAMTTLQDVTPAGQKTRLEKN